MVAILVCSLALIISFVSDRVASATLEAVAEEQAKALTRELAERISAVRNRQFHSLDLLRMAVAAHNERGIIAFSAVQDLARFAMEEQTDIDQLWVIPYPHDIQDALRGDTDDHVLVLTRTGGQVRASGWVDNQDRELIARVLGSGRPQVDELRPSAVREDTSGTMTRVDPVMLGDEVVGLIGYDVGMNGWVRIGDAVERPFPGTRLSIVSADGRYAYHDDHSLIGKPVPLGDDRPGQLTEREMADVRNGQGFSSLRTIQPDGAAFRRVGLQLPFLFEDHSRFLVLDMPLSAFTTTLPDAGQRLVWVTCAAGLVLLLIAVRWAVVRLIGHPLEQLRAAVRRLDLGDYTPDVPLLDRGDQVGDIARALEDLRRSAGERNELRAMVVRNAQDVERMVAAIDAATDMVMVMDTDWSVIYANHAACTLFGAADPDDVVGRNWNSLIDHRTAERLRTLGVPDALRRTGYWEGVLDDWRTTFGRCVEALEAQFTRRVNGDVVAVGRDVSARRVADREKADLERRLSQMDKMDAVGRLAGGIAHDFNNLLGAISGYADFLVTDIQAGTPQNDYARRITRVCERAKDMVKQILAFSRAGGVELAPTKTRALLDDVKMFLQTSIPASVALEFSNPANLPPVMANGTQLVQVLVNLAINARDAMPGEAGRITVAARVWDGGEDPARDGAGDWTMHQTLPPRPGRLHVLFEVRDNGSGMSAAVIARAFDPFFTTKEQGKGTGLGLAVVFGIIQAHDGGLVVCSREGEGTIIRVFIPVAVLPAVVTEDAAPVDVVPRRTATRCRVLVVDDEREMGDMMSVGLERIGHEVAICESPQEALEVVEDEPDAFDVVVTDQTMPGLTGITLIERLKARRPDLPCILYTGFSPVVDESTARAAGADAFFLKPVNMATLAEAVERLASRKA